MAYQVLSIKWRPKKFNEVIGQEHVTTALSNAIKLDRVAHAFCFAGPRGVGKTTVARILAKELNNIESIESNFDIFEMDAASNRGIDEIRNLRENISILPVNSSYKIYIIDEVHMLTKEAFNALLKTLEEPPEYVVFILATTDPYKLPSTILSRTQRYDFKRISIDNIAKQLSSILQHEGMEYDEKSMTVIAQKADGSMRDALSYLDQVINFCDGCVEFEKVQKILGVISDDIYFDLLKSIVQKESKEVVDLISSSIVRSISVNDFLLGFNVFLKKVLTYVICGYPKKREKFYSWILANKSLLTELYIVRIMDLLMQFQVNLKLVDQKETALEIMMIKIANLDSIVDISSLIHKVKNLKHDSSIHAKKESAFKISDNKLVNKDKDLIIKKETMVSHENINDGLSQSSSKQIISKSKIIDYKKDILLELKKHNEKTSIFLEGFKVDSVVQNNIVVEVENINSFTYNALVKDQQIINNAFSKILDYSCLVTIKKPKADNKVKAESKKQVSDESHPLLMNVLERFEGKIVK